MAMLNLFGRKNRIKKQKRKIARTVQQSIPIDAIYKDGIFRTGRLFSKSWKFSDINYAVASDDDQLQMFLAHSAILNGLPTDAMAEITIYNRQLHNKVFEQITTPSDNPNYRKYTKELNGILCDKMSESNNIVHEKYITVATEKKNIEEARTFFTRVGNDLTADYAKISSKIAELGYKDRLRIFNDFFKTGENEEFDFDLKKAMAKGADFKDYIAPDSLESRFSLSPPMKQLRLFRKNSLPLKRILQNGSRNRTKTIIFPQTFHMKWSKCEKKSKSFLTI